MKTNLCVVVFSILLICTACTKEKITPPEPDTPAMAIARSAIEKTSECLLSGKWEIIHYLKKNVNQTPGFKNYAFTFSPGGSLIAARDGQNLVGKWVISYIDGQTRLSIDFSYPGSFVELSGDWMVTGEKENELVMQNVVTVRDQLTIERK